MSLMKHVHVDDLYKSMKDLKREDVDELRKWLNAQPHLPKELKELYLIAALHSCQYKMEATKRCIDKFLTMRQQCPDLLLNRNPYDKEMQLCFKTVSVSIMPKFTNDGYVIIYSRFLDTNADNYNLNNAVKAFSMAISIFLEEHGPKLGYYAILDCTGGTLKHLLKSNVMTVKKFIYFLQEALPVPMYGIHFVNAVSFMDKIIALVKPFIKPDVFDLIHIHSGDNATLFSYMQKDCVPTDVGGSCCDAKNCHDQFVAKTYECVELFREEDALLVDESKRTDKSTLNHNFFGVEGTFKKLDID